jgi:hypothetical protein
MHSSIRVASDIVYTQLCVSLFKEEIFMKILLWAFAGCTAVLFSYSMRMTQATLSYGREIMNTNEGTGVQDAITPPWATNISMLAYACLLASVGIIWWQFGWGEGLGALALVVIGGGIVGAMLPDANSPHFRGLIQRSMVSRYADFARGGDQMRADAMGDLLHRAGIDPGEQKLSINQSTALKWSTQRAENVVNDYGWTLGNKKPGPNGMVADEAQLPHPKTVIKQAILYLLAIGEVTNEQKDALVTGFVSLADFQPGVDDGDKGVDAGSAEFISLSAEEQIKSLAAGGLGQEWLEKSAAERDELVAELKREGHWRE